MRTVIARLKPVQGQVLLMESSGFTCKEIAEVAGHQAGFAVRADFAGADAVRKRIRAVVREGTVMARSDNATKQRVDAWMAALAPAEDAETKHAGRAGRGAGTGRNGPGIPAAAAGDRMAAAVSGAGAAWGGVCGADVRGHEPDGAAGDHAASDGVRSESEALCGAADRGRRRRRGEGAVAGHEGPGAETCAAAVHAADDRGSYAEAGDDADHRGAAGRGAAAEQSANVGRSAGEAGDRIERKRVGRWHGERVLRRTGAGQRRWVRAGRRRGNSRGL